MNDHFLDFLDRAPGSAWALEDDQRRITFDELRNLVQRTASVLRGRYGSDQYLLLPATSNIDFVATLLGTIESGNTPIPIDPGLPEAAVRYLLDKSQAVGVVTPPDHEELAAADPGSWRRSDRPVMVLFTSGTSGLPKGVMISHGNLLHSSRAISHYLDYHSHPSAAVVLPLHYSYALLSQVCCMLYVGGLSRLFAEFRNPLKFARVVEERRLETFCGVPSTYHALCKIHALSPLRMPSVRILCSAGAAMDQSRYQEVKEIFPNAVFFNNYGMTEAAPRISYIRDDDPRFHESTCGRPMDGVEVRIVDPESHASLPDGSSGVLVVRGPNITCGYLNDPELTQAAFTRDGFLISGDMASLDHGYIMIHGRYDDVFNVGGEKVAPLEIERALNRHAAVELSAVIGVPDEQRGRVPVAFVKLSQQVARKELIEHLRRFLPDAKIPLRYLAVRSFPMTANGKLQRARMSVDDREHVVAEVA